ncbi:hypothetical protein BTHERMOSOX_623 [Bathymodiolus thermophilus thioautotrophic gill symbiont]|nr:hypothetical protein BTHERMOSOX_623 [Bathymodiolus thermophilus thioautotrophic gill symbiont]
MSSLYSTIFKNKLNNLAPILIPSISSKNTWAYKHYKTFV